MEARIGADPCLSMEVPQMVRLSGDAFDCPGPVPVSQCGDKGRMDRQATKGENAFSRDKYLNWVQGSGFKVQTPGAEPRTLEIQSVQVPLCLELLHIRPEQNPYGGELGTSHERSGIACRGSLFLRLKNNI
jgi:hypothetical protein